MSLRRLHLLGAAFLLAAAASASLQPSHAHGMPASGQVATDRAQLNRALTRLAASQARVARVESDIRRNSRRLDTLVEQENRLQSQLSERVRAMYRSGETPFIAVLMNAKTYEDFTNGWTLLARVNRRDARLLGELAEARRAASHTAGELLKLQASAAKEVDAQRSAVVRSRRELAASTAALAVYQRQTRRSARQAVSASAPSVSSPRAKNDEDERTGSGAWKSAVASHYGRNFTGRGASGQRIGPYSMIVAHKTLPFGTLIEFRYNGKRAVARVADRGPYGHGRSFDLGPGVIRVLGFSGVHSVQYRVIGR